MKRYGWAIRTGGDPDIADALADGIAMGTRTVPDDKERPGNEAVRRVAMMRHTQEEWEAMIVQARYDYGQDPPTPRWAEALLVGYALICYGVALAFERLWQAIEGRLLG